MKRFLLLAALLTLIASAARAQDRPLPPTPEKDLHWKADAAFADSFITEGETIRLIRQDGIMVAVYGYTDGNYVIAEVTVANDSEKRLTVKPEDFFLTYRDDKNKFGYSYSLPPEKIAKSFQSRAKWGNFFRAMGAGMSQTTSTSQTTGNVSVYGSGGYGNGTYNSTTTTTGPDRAAQARAAEANRRANAEAGERAIGVMNAALKANTVFPKTYVSGLVYFPRKKNQVSILYLIIDGTAYSFSFGPTKK